MVLQNLKIAIRVLLKNPLFASTVVATMALGLGAVTAIFSVTNGVCCSPFLTKIPTVL